MSTLIMMMKNEGRKPLNSFRFLVYKLHSPQDGFTLIELLIVIAVLGVLAAIIITFLNPIEQLKRGRDTGRKQTVARLARTAQAYYTTNFVWPSVSTGTPNGTIMWIDTIVNAQDLPSVPPDVSFTGSGCGTGPFNKNGYCFYFNDPNAFIMTQLESDQEKSKCASGETAYFMYSSGDGKAGTICYDPSTGWDWTIGHYNFN